MKTATPKKQIVESFDLLTKAITCGAISFYYPTGEVRFRGILSMTRSFTVDDWVSWLSSRKDEIEKEIIEKEKTRYEN